MFISNVVAISFYDIHSIHFVLDPSTLRMEILG